MTPDVAAPWAQLASAIDCFALLGGLMLLLVGLAALESAWVAVTRPLPIRAFTRTWVAVPGDLPMSAAPGYGRVERRRAYRATLARATYGSALGFAFLISAWAWWLQARPAPRSHDFRSPVIVPIFPPTGPVEMHDHVRSTGPAPLPAELRRLLERRVVPSRDHPALLDTVLTGLTLEDVVEGIHTSDEGTGDGLLPERTADATALPQFVPGDAPTVELSRVEQLPLLVTLPAPAYPMMARDAGIEGAVELDLLISPRGTVEDARVRHSIPALDAAARSAALAARFRPALWQGRPVRVWASLTIRFRLENR